MILTNYSPLLLCHFASPQPHATLRHLPEMPTLAGGPGNISAIIAKTYRFAKDGKSSRVLVANERSLNMEHLIFPFIFLLSVLIFTSGISRTFSRCRITIGSLESIFTSPKAIEVRESHTRMSHGHSGFTLTEEKVTVTYEFWREERGSLELISINTPTSFGITITFVNRRVFAMQWHLEGVISNPTLSAREENIMVGLLERVRNRTSDFLRETSPK